MLVVSPGVPLTEPAVARAIAAGIEVVGDVELFARAIRALNAKREHPMRVIAITGSNGKSTVTAMCGDMCRMAGLVTCVAGNIALPVLDALSEIEQGREPDTSGVGARTVELPARDHLEPECRCRHGAQPVGRPHGSLPRHGSYAACQGTHLQWPWRASAESRRSRARWRWPCRSPQSDQLRPRPLSHARTISACARMSCAMAPRC
jgi:hypothetical protein